MKRQKLIFSFFILLALTFNFGFVVGEFDNPDHHNIYELHAALIVSLIATAMKLTDRTYAGSVFLATSLVADLQLILAAALWWYALSGSAVSLDSSMTASVVSLASGALLANLASVVLLVLDTVKLRD
ncbi:MAG: DUF6394 family protein [Pseudomonadota bacterium]